MNAIKKLSKAISSNSIFELAITFVIIVNSVLIGVETYTSNSTISLIQSIILYIFTIEIILRFIAADSLKSFFKDGWNVFDLSLVIIGYIPEDISSDASAMMALRVLRVFRVLRLLRSAKEIKIIVNVLLASTKSMFYNLILFLIFIYLYAIAGVAMFRIPPVETMTAEEKVKYEELQQVAPNAPSNSKDPFGSLDEAAYTLFRELTGDDWTDIRYNHITAHEYGLIKTSPTIINIYHISWFCLSVFLLMNLVTGAIINNYQMAIEERKNQKEEEE